jgi:hypothetical protein
LNVSDCAGLLVSGIVAGEVEHALAKPCCHSFIGGGDNQNKQTASSLRDS